MALDRSRLRELELRLARIANVEAASIRTGDTGEIEAVDIVADRGRPPQKIVRDAEILFRQDGIDLDHRKIGVAALDAPAALFDSRQSPGVSDSSPTQPDVPSRPAELAVLSIEPDEDYYPWQAGLFTPALEAHDGKVQIPDGPGWGVEVNPDWLAAAEHQVSELD